MTILVTGGAGFIGSHLCERLIGNGHRVICVDNFLTGNKRNIAHLLKKKNFQCITHDIIVPLYLKQKINQIYNLACPASPVQYQKNAIRTIKANTIGVINMLGFAKQHKARILQASTSEVYGDPAVSPQPETYRGNVNPIGPRACYDEGKRVAETLFFDYHRSHGLDIRVARIFNTYGPRMAKDDGRVISNFVVQALCGKPLTLYGDGAQTRSFCYVSDMVEGLVRLMEKEKVTGPVNFGNPQEMTIREIAQMIFRLTGSVSKIVKKPLPEDDPTRRCPDITLAKKTLEWKPRVALEDGLALTIEYFRRIV